MRNMTRDEVEELATIERRNVTTARNLARSNRIAELTRIEASARRELQQLRNEGLGNG